MYLEGVEYFKRRGGSGLVPRDHDVDYLFSSLTAHIYLITLCELSLVCPHELRNVAIILAVSQLENLKGTGRKICVHKDV